MVSKNTLIDRVAGTVLAPATILWDTVAKPDHQEPLLCHRKRKPHRPHHHQGEARPLP